MNLFALSVISGAIVAETVSSVARSSFVRRYIAPGRARVVVVMYASHRRFRCFVDGIKRGYLRHTFSLFIDFYSVCTVGIFRSQGDVPSLEYHDPMHTYHRCDKPVYSWVYRFRKSNEMPQLWPFSSSRKSLLPPEAL